MSDAAQKLDNLANALVEDILKAPDEETLLEALEDRFRTYRDRITFLEAQLAGERKNIAGWIAARDAQLARAEDAERQLADVRLRLQADCL